jgi:hypothetical protein
MHESQPGSGFVAHIKPTCSAQISQAFLTTSTPEVAEWPPASETHHPTTLSHQPDHPPPVDCLLCRRSLTFRTCCRARVAWWTYGDSGCGGGRGKVSDDGIRGIWPAICTWELTCGQRDIFVRRIRHSPKVMRGSTSDQAELTMTAWEYGPIFAGAQ